MQKSIQLALKVQAVIACRNEGLDQVLLLQWNAYCHHRRLRCRHLLLEVHAARIELPDEHG